MRSIFDFHRDRAKDEGTSELLALTPSYEQTSHEVYFNAIESALTGKNCKVIKNIALSGSYGVGKSSILQKVAAEHAGSVVQVSLSTLGLPDETDVSASSPTEATSKTNRIQKEIVKQLLYREDPDKTPGSRFRRIGQFKKMRGLGLAALFALALTVMFYLAGWTSKLVELLKSHFDPGLWAHLGLFAVFTAFVFALEAAFHNRLRIQSLTAGYATVSLSPETATYFDQYLDEIVYFFEVTKSDIVIFEDIDRFDDPHIFETLRALNSLLNGAKQLDGRSVRFIYAIKDSIFDELGVRAAREALSTDGLKRADAVDSELARANRTKFFDLVVPVVPFITHRSARDLMTRTLSDIEHHVTIELIDLASRYVADMRLIKNIRNEFVIFRQMVLKTDDGNLELNEDSLFAMMLYKSTHLTDFEQIKMGKSKLDQLYWDSRKLVTESIASLNAEARECSQRLANPDSIEARSEDLGNRLLEYIERVVRHIVSSQPAHHRINMNNKSWADTELQSPEFWEIFASSGGGAEPVLSISIPPPRQMTIKISRADASKALGESLSVDDWNETDRAALSTRLKEIKEGVEFLSHADMNELIDHEEYKVSTGESLRELTDRHLESELSVKLASEGYINRDFTLYASTYYSERVSTRARNFLIHNVAPNVVDMHFQLEPDDVEAIIRERGNAVLRERSMYNIMILDHLLESGDDRTNQVLGSLAAFGADERQFLDAYLVGGTGQESLIRGITGLSDRVITFIVSRADLEETVKVNLLNAALESTIESRRYVADDETRAFIEKHYTELAVFTSPSTDAALAKRIGALVVAMKARLLALAPLGDAVRHSVVAASCYLITRDNLVVALNGKEDLALDQILDQDEVVYRYVVRNLPEYLAAISETVPAAHSIESPAAFGRVVTDVTENANQLLAEVLAKASPTCQLQSLAEVPNAAWRALAHGHRFSTTFENVTAYINSLGGIDAQLAGHLESTAVIEVPESVAESDKATLARDLLAARDVLPDPKTRVALVVSLGSTQYLDSAMVEPEAGQLLGLLIEHEVLEDASQSFALASETDWKTREFAISKSKQFASFMTPAEVPASDIAPLMASVLVPDSVKIVVLHRINEFVPVDDRTILTAVASFADRKQEKVSIDVVNRLASAHVGSPLLLRVLKPLLSELAEPQLVPILKAMGDVYAPVAERNGKRPKLPKTDPDIALVKRLQELGIVNSHQLSDNMISVYMKKG